jgi:hypothetical protein
MRTFEFEYENQPFKALFKEGMIRYDWQEIASHFGVENPSFQKVTSAEALALIPPDKVDSFRKMHQIAQDTLFEIIRIDNEID